MRITDFAQTVLRQGEESARFQDPNRLTEEFLTVGHIHCHVLRVAAVEAHILVWKALTVSMLDRDRFRESYHFCESVSRHHKRFGNVDAFDVAAKTLGEVSCRPAEAAPDVDEPITSGDRKDICQVLRRGKPTRVEVIDRGQLFYGHGVGVDPGSLHGIENAREDIARSPVIRD